MSEQEEKQESQKTVVAFIAGLLIGGLLVWVFSASPEEAVAPSDTNDTKVTESSSDGIQNGDSATDDDAKPEAEFGVGSAEVVNQSAGFTVDLIGATFPNDEGWVGVREYNNDKLGYLLGVVRFSKVQGLIPEVIILQSSTVPGQTYAVVFFQESGDRVFNIAEDAQIAGIFSPFTIQ